MMRVEWESEKRGKKEDMCIVTVAVASIVRLITYDTRSLTRVTLIVDTSAQILLC